MMNSILEPDITSMYGNYKLSLQEKIVLESDYVQKNISAFRYIRNRDYTRASEAYKECLILSNKLGNSFKIKDSLCNYGVSLYYCGNFEEAVNNLENAFNKLTNKDINYIHNKTDFLSIQLSIKIISNLIVLYLCLNNFNNAMIMIEHLTNILKNFDFIPNLQLNLIKNINYIFFRIESLVNLDECLGGLPRDAHHQVIIRIMKGFHSYLKNNNIDVWINCLNSEIDNLKNLKDYNGIILALTNIQSGNYIKGKENMNTNLVNNSKNKFWEILRAINNNLNNNNDNNEFSEEDIDKALMLIKDKMNIAIKIYNLLYDKEMNILNNNDNSNLNFNNNFRLNKTHTNNNFYPMNNHSNNSYSPNNSSYSSKYYHNNTDRTMNNNNNLYNNKYNNNNNIMQVSNPNNTGNNNLNTVFFTKLLLKYALKYIKKNINNPSLEKQLCSHIEFTLKFLDNDELDISYLKLSDLSPEIAKSLELLFMNLLKIYERRVLSKYFNRYKRVINKIIRRERNIALNKMLERNFMSLKTGEVLMKINYNSKDTKMHHYLLDAKNNCISVFNKSGGSEPESEIYFKNIIKILYGIKTTNLIKKIKNLPNSDQPYLYMSFLLRNRSIDLSFSEKNVKKWFYGLYYYLINTNRSYKISSCTNFMLNRIKMKINYSLNNIGENKSEGENDYKIKLQIKGAIKNRNNTFAKSILLYNKINKI